MKKCIYCGKELPDDAHFCPYCTKEQTEPTAVSVPKVRSLRWLYFAVPLLLAGLACIYFFVIRHIPKTYKGTSAEVLYPYEGSEWHLVLRTAVDDEPHWQVPMPLYSRTLSADGNTDSAAMPLQLYVFDEKTGENVAEAFREALDHSEISSEIQGKGNPLEFGTPDIHEGFPFAAQEIDVVFHPDSGNHLVSWTFHMKNGDTIILCEKMEIAEQIQLTYTYEDTPLSTMEEVQAFLDSQKDTKDPNALIQLVLAPVTYTGHLSINDYQLSITGTTEGDQRTTIQGSIEVNVFGPGSVELTNIHLEGDGTGTGITATAPFFFYQCSLNNYEVGIEALDGSWPMVFESTIENCGTGLYFNSSNAPARSYYYSDNIFRNNDTAILLEKIPSTDVLYFISFTFENNGTDIDNRSGNEIQDTL